MYEADSNSWRTTEFYSLCNQYQWFKLARTNKVTKGNDEWQKKWKSCVLRTWRSPWWQSATVNVFSKRYFIISGGLISGVILPICWKDNWAWWPFVLYYTSRIDQDLRKSAEYHEYNCFSHPDCPVCDAAKCNCTDTGTQFSLVFDILSLFLRGRGRTSNCHLTVLFW